MAEINDHKGFLITGKGNLNIDSVQDVFESIVGDKASDSSLRDFAQTAPSGVFDVQPAKINAQLTAVQMLESTNEGPPQMEQAATIPKKKLSYSTSARKNRRRWKEEEKKQIALGIYSSEEIPAVVNAARKETKRQYRKEHKLRKAMTKEALDKANNDAESGCTKSICSDGDGLQTGYEARLSPKIGKTTAEENMEAQ
ncbi:hypothetical protein OCU04_007873 [Sclerotinia nivalis]|uniref:Uncharacterized protein n=1 Tax=Sclerotinia nivalis TaxID=352851 RepID=A0A9X0AJP8_9HELO|nr:hypothetical protein OCU04_007873 [Sclerotinia nivalis]